MSEQEASESPGWDAIDGALHALYGQQLARHSAPALPAALGGNDPLDGISVYRSDYGGRAHWHYVTYGYSELYGKESDDLEHSGFGFEMTLRVLDPVATDEPPTWPISVLQNIARYVFHTGNVFEPGHHSSMNGPIALERDTRLVAALFVEDPELPLLHTPNGKVTFVQLVGLTDDEYQAVCAWDTHSFVEILRTRDAALLTDLDRGSWLEDPEVRALVERGTARDGSSMGTLFGTRGSLGNEGARTVLGVAANVLDNLRDAMRARLDHGHTFQLVWPEGSVVLAPAPQADSLVLDEADRRALEAIPVQRGDYPLPSGLVIRVLPIEIYDGARKQVVRVVG